MFENYFNTSKFLILAFPTILSPIAEKQAVRIFFSFVFNTILDNVCVYCTKIGGCFVGFCVPEATHPFVCLHMS